MRRKINMIAALALAMAFFVTACGAKEESGKANPRATMAQSETEPSRETQTSPERTSETEPATEPEAVTERATESTAEELATGTAAETTRPAAQATTKPQPATQAATGQKQTQPATKKQETTTKKKEAATKKQEATTKKKEVSTEIDFTKHTWEECYNGTFPYWSECPIHFREPETGEEVIQAYLDGWNEQVKRFGDTILPLLTIKDLDPVLCAGAQKQAENYVELPAFGGYIVERGFDFFGDDRIYSNGYASGDSPDSCEYNWMDIFLTGMERARINYDTYSFYGIKKMTPNSNYIFGIGWKQRQLQTVYGTIKQVDIVMSEFAIIE